MTNPTHDEHLFEGDVTQAEFDELIDAGTPTAAVTAYDLRIFVQVGTDNWGASSSELPVSFLGSMASVATGDRLASTS